MITARVESNENPDTSFTVPVCSPVYVTVNLTGELPTFTFDLEDVTPIL